MVGNYVPTSSVINMDGNIGSSRVAGVYDTPYGPYIAFALKDAGHVYIVDYSKPGYPIVGDIPNIGKILHDGFENEGKEIGRYLMQASQGSDLMGIIDFKTKSLVAKVYTGQGSSWYNERYGQLFAINSMNVGDVVARIRTAGGGLFVGTSENTPYICSDNVIGGKDNWNKISLIGK